jgi:S1-C subfamily serine protease
MDRRHIGTSGTVIALVLVCGLIIGGLATAYVFLRRINSLENEISNLTGLISRISVNQTVYNETITVFQNETALAEMYKTVKESVVLVQGETSSGSVQGSGFVYNATGLMVIVTNNHVVVGTTRLSVTFFDGHGYAATVNGTDPYADLAVVTVASAPQDEFKPLSIASSSTLNVGDPVIAIGAPFGLVGSMTTGMVSALGRTISETEYSGGFPIANIIQTSAPINPGNSGGPLLNLDGKVVGITAAIVENSQGVGFAIPSNAIFREINWLISTGSYDQHSYLGVTGQDMDYFTAVKMNTNVTYGWLIGSVVSGGPAADAHVQDRDIIVGINQTVIISGDVMSSYLEEQTIPGDTVIMHLIRDNQPLDLSLVLDSRPPPP